MNFRAPILVGLLLMGAAASTTWFVISTSKDKFDIESTYPLFADFSDASGIRWKTRVQINGIDVGKIQSIDHVQLEDGSLTARVEIRILKKYQVYKNATLRKAAESLLGDFRLDLLPGTRKAKLLKPGETIPNVQSISDIEEIQSELKQVARNVNRITDSFQKVLTGPEGEGSLQAILNRMEKSMEAIEITTSILSKTLSQNDNYFGRIIRNIDQFTGTLVSLVGDDGDIKTMTTNGAQLAVRLNDLVDKLNTFLLGSGNELEENSPIRVSLNNLNESIEHLNSIARKVDEGQGTIGRIINDSAIAEKVEQTLDDTNELIGSLSKLETQVELRTEYGVPFDGDNILIQKAIKNTLGLRIIPRPDKYYILEAIADPRGLQTRTITTENGFNGEATETEVTQTSFNDLKFSAQMAKRYYFLAMRFGIIENTGGFGVDFFGLEDKLELRFDMFDFDRRDPEDNASIFPRIRTTGLFEFYNHIYFQAGLDDPLNKELRTWFFGGVLRFTDEDLKALLTIAPSPF